MRLSPSKECLFMSKFDTASADNFSLCLSNRKHSIDTLGNMPVTRSSTRHKQSNRDSRNIPPKVICNIRIDFSKDYPGHYTRSISKLLHEVKDIVIFETYRCMPLLGDELIFAPEWDVHIVRYSLVFI